MTSATMCVRRARLVAFVLVALFGVLPLIGPAAAETTEDVLAAQILAQLNTERAARGVPSLQVDSNLEPPALAWSRRMADSGGLNHSTDGRAEIIARGWWTGQITEAWMYSPSHRNLVVDPNLRFAGVGVACDGQGQMWVTVQFLRLDTSLGTLKQSSQSPVVTNGQGGSDCGDSPMIQQVRRLYVAYFQRESDTDGLAFWAGQLSDGAPLAEVSDAFAQSGEFRSLYGSVQDRRFVQLVYQNVMGRGADNGGLDYWTAQLRAGMTRGEVMVGFSESREFRSRTGIN